MHLYDYAGGTVLQLYELQDPKFVAWMDWFCVCTIMYMYTVHCMYNWLYVRSQLCLHELYMIRMLLWRLNIFQISARRPTCNLMSRMCVYDDRTQQPSTVIYMSIIERPKFPPLVLLAFSFYMSHNSFVHFLPFYHPPLECFCGSDVPCYRRRLSFFPSISILFNLHHRCGQTGLIYRCHGVTVNSAVGHNSRHMSISGKSNLLSSSSSLSLSLSLSVLSSVLVLFLLSLFSCCGFSPSAINTRDFICASHFGRIWSSIARRAASSSLCLFHRVAKLHLLRTLAHDLAPWGCFVWRVKRLHHHHIITFFTQTIFTSLFPSLLHLSLSPFVISLLSLFLFVFVYYPIYTKSATRVLRLAIFLLFLLLLSSFLASSLPIPIPALFVRSRVCMSFRLRLYITACFILYSRFVLPYIFFDEGVSSVPYNHVIHSQNLRAGFENCNGMPLHFFKNLFCVLPRHLPLFFLKNESSFTRGLIFSSHTFTFLFCDFNLFFPF